MYRSAYKKLQAKAKAMTDPEMEGREILAAEDPTGRTETIGRAGAAATADEPELDLGTAEVVIWVGQTLVVTVCTLW